MIITSTPYRISLFGGGTDYPTWFREHGGAVLSSTINKYCYLSVRNLAPFFEHKSRIVYSKIENVRTIDEIKHPAAREVLRYCGIEQGVEIHHDGDLPARSGIGSSSAFTVGLLQSLWALRGRMSSKQSLASEAIHIEREVLGETVGCQDQIAVAYGGFNRIDFHPEDRGFEVQPMTLRKERIQELQDHLMLFFTGTNRISSDYAAKIVANVPSRRPELSSMRSMVDEAISILDTPTRPITEIGKLLHETWMLKRELSKEMSSSRIDEGYERARANGAIGGKLLGAGGGGFFLVFAAPEYHEQVRRSLEGFLHVSFQFESHGSRIVFYDPSV